MHAVEESPDTTKGADLVDRFTRGNFDWLVLGGSLTFVGTIVAQSHGSQHGRNFIKRGCGASVVASTTLMNACTALDGRDCEGKFVHVVTSKDRVGRIRG